MKIITGMVHGCMGMANKTRDDTHRPFRRAVEQKRNRTRVGVGWGIRVGVGVGVGLGLKEIRIAR